jgi:rhamnose utilization protein RhaD (predicted bifunctional aldolase and dehydrogenase)/NAD(P)-dependent dehydrogenase (short-subunit alcohol dehydrogenase family)
MKSLWNDEEASLYPGELGQRVYSSRLLGREPALVLHGGGNTSVKLNEKNLLGEEEVLLYVKGSGADLEHIEASGFAPVRLNPLLKLAKLPALSDPEMVNALRTHMTRADAPTPSVEAILHAILPHRFVDHTHADAVLAVMNSRDGETRIRDIYGDSVVIIPYVMPGFDLARAVADRFPAAAGPKTVGMILLHHGVFAFGHSARETYERMIDLVTRAEDYLAKHHAWNISAPALTPGPVPLRRELAALRREVSMTAGFPLILSAHTDSRSLAFVRREDLARLTQQGPATPDHAIRTKRLPLLGRDVAAYADAYRKYFDAYGAQAKEPKTMLDPAPRVLLDPQLGVCTLGRSAKEAAIVHDIYSHTMDIQLRAARLGGYQALSPKDIFDVEYWDLEQAKLKKGGKPPLFAGEIALVTGAASGIGKACVESLLARGAAVIGLDIDPAIAKQHKRPDFVGFVCDVTDEPRLIQAIEHGARAFGGLDMLILNAGLFPPGTRIESLAMAEWHKVMRVNLDANLALLREAHALLKLAPHGGRVVVIGSKNVPAPGPGAAAYSASKAALQQLARVAALEWASDGIRLNTLHPDAVFDTGVWTEEVLMARAAHYGMTVEGYKRKNLLKTEITSKDVAELAAELCGPLFAKTTGAQIPVDGGNERVI